MKYIQENKDYDGCIFCLAAKSDEDFDNLVFHRGKHAFMILNRYPYTSGHVMCVPYAHQAHLQDLTPETRSEIMELTTKAVQVLQSLYQPEGFNVGLNLGEMAGAGIEQHLHMHIVPRWGGDTNFMSTIGETRVLPEALNQTYQRVKQAWEEFKES
ncbi:MAG: HIT domain-containing protein [Chloroflexota bacterium]|jgi:ATP adenylyltransferase|nr:HIT domain-containing protein [Chloroflexota bacterium]